MSRAEDHPAHHVGIRTAEALIARDWESLVEMYSADVVREDRRSLGLPTVRGREARIAELQMGVDAIGLADASWTVIATRGDRLALSRIYLVGAEGYEIDFLSLVRLDDDSRIDLQARFDSDDVDAAIAELDQTAGRPEIT